MAGFASPKPRRGGTKTGFLLKKTWALVERRGGGRATLEVIAGIRAGRSSCAYLKPPRQRCAGMPPSSGLASHGGPPHDLLAVSPRNCGAVLRRAPDFSVTMPHAWREFPR